MQNNEPLTKEEKEVMGHEVRNYERAKSYYEKNIRQKIENNEPIGEDTDQTPADYKEEWEKTYEEEFGNSAKGYNHGRRPNFNLDRSLPHNRKRAGPYEIHPKLKKHSDLKKIPKEKRWEYDLASDTEEYVRKANADIMSD